MSIPEKVWFVTGISRGLGKALAEAVLARGDAVIGTTRDGTSDIDPRGGALHVIALDLSTPDGIAEAVERAYSRYVRIDVLVNNAGFGLMGAVEECDEADVDEMFQVNFFAPFRLIKGVLPLMRARRTGHIINISSIAGITPMPGTGLYAASKFALEGMSESLAQEVAPLGIRVTVVEPGAFRTDFLSSHSIRTADRHIHDYTNTSGSTARMLSNIAGRQLGNPAEGARAIIQAVESSDPPLHLVLGSDALGRARAKLQRFSDDLNHWESVSVRTDFADSRR